MYWKQALFCFAPTTFLLFFSFRKAILAMAKCNPTTRQKCNDIIEEETLLRCILEEQWLFQRHLLLWTNILRLWRKLTLALEWSILLSVMKNLGFLECLHLRIANDFTHNNCVNLLSSLISFETVEFKGKACLLIFGVLLFLCVCGRWTVNDWVINHHTTIHLQLSKIKQLLSESTESPWENCLAQNWIAKQNICGPFQ